MLVETIRLKLPRAFKARFEQEFMSLLAEPPVPARAVVLIEVAAAYRGDHIRYTGQQTHEKRILAHIEELPPTDLSESELVLLGRGLLGLEARKPLGAWSVAGQSLFPNNPYFYWLEAEAHLLRGMRNCPRHQVIPLLEQATRLSHHLPPSERDDLLERLQKRQELLCFTSALPAANSIEAFLEELLGAFDARDRETSSAAGNQRR
jgi:hypothetical protein